MKFTQSIEKYREVLTSLLLFHFIGMEHTIELFTVTVNLLQ